MSSNPTVSVHRQCQCGHTALDHHGLDHNPVHGGCHGAGNGITAPKCPCAHTCGTVPHDQQATLFGVSA